MSILLLRVWICMVLEISTVLLFLFSFRFVFCDFPISVVVNGLRVTDDSVSVRSLWQRRLPTFVCFSSVRRAPTVLQRQNLESGTILESRTCHTAVLDSRWKPCIRAVGQCALCILPSLQLHCRYTLTCLTYVLHIMRCSDNRWERMDRRQIFPAVGSVADARQTFSGSRLWCQ